MPATVSGGGTRLSTALQNGALKVWALELEVQAPRVLSQVTLTSPMLQFPCMENGDAVRPVPASERR